MRGWSIPFVLALVGALFLGGAATTERGLVHGTYLRYRHTIDGFKNPQGIFYDAERDELFVADTDAGNVSVFSGDGVPLWSVGRRNGLEYPLGIVAIREGELLVSELQSGVVKVLTPQGRSSGTVVLPEEGLKIGPLCLDRRGNIYMADRRQGVILKFSPTLDLLARFTLPPGPRPPFPAALLVKGEEILVADAFRQEVVRLSSGGDLLGAVGGSGEGGVSFPSGLAVDQHGRLWVVDALRHQLKLFDDTLAFVKNLGGIGTEPGEFYFPLAIAVDGRRGRLFVLERGNGRVQAFSLHN